MNIKVVQALDLRKGRFVVLCLVTVIPRGSALPVDDCYKAAD
jgi:uncharacterized protein YraI